MSDDDDLEKIIATLIERKYAAPEGSAEHRLAVRELAGLRYSREEAGPIMEDLDPLGWGAVRPNAARPGMTTGTVLRAVVIYDAAASARSRFPDMDMDDEEARQCTVLDDAVEAAWDTPAKPPAPT